MRHLHSAFYRRMQIRTSGTGLSECKSEKRWVLRAFLKDVMLVEYLTDGGRRCQRRGAEIEKARSPVRVWNLGILHKMPLDERRK